MKIKPEHYATLKATLEDVAHLYPEFVARFSAMPKIKDADRAARWQLLREAQAIHWLCDTLYPYLNDTHVDTALRHAYADITTTPWKHDAPINPAFSGAQPARNGEDY